MRTISQTGLTGALLLGLCACGGSKQSTPAPPLPPDTAAKAMGAFLLIESIPSAPSALPSWQPLAEGNASQLLTPLPLGEGCVGTQSVLNPDGSTTFKATFACSSQVDGSTLSGALWFTFSAANPGSYLFEYKDLKRVKDTQSWTVNGSKQVLLDLPASRAILRTPTPMTMSFLDTANPATSRVFSYGCHLTSDWATAGTYKLWGTFSLQSGNEALSGSIAELQPLVWSLGCCYPVSGTITLAQGTARSDAIFPQPCGNYTISGIQTLVPLTLPACPN
jgi:hypothetical protein